MTNARNARTTREKAAELRAEAARQEARHRAVLIGVAIVTAVLVIVGAGVLIQTARQESIDAANDTTPPANLVDGAVVVGKADAPVTVTLYSDYICPYCGLAHHANKEQLDAWVAEGKVKLEYRLVAFLDGASTDNYSTRALNMVAAVVNAKPEAFTVVNDTLFSEQPEEGGAGLPDKHLVEIAVAAGAPEAEIRKAVENLTFRGWVRATTEEASKAGVNATPTFEVNGTAVKNAADAESVKAAVEKALGAG